MEILLAILLGCIGLVAGWTDCKAERGGLNWKGWSLLAAVVLLSGASATLAYRSSLLEDRLAAAEREIQLWQIQSQVALDNFSSFGANLIDSTRGSIENGSPYFAWYPRMKLDEVQASATNEGERTVVIETSTAITTDIAEFTQLQLQAIRYRLNGTIEQLKSVPVAGDVSTLDFLVRDFEARTSLLIEMRYTESRILDNPMRTVLGLEPIMESDLSAESIEWIEAEIRNLNEQLKMSVQLSYRDRFCELLNSDELNICL